MPNNRIVHFEIPAGKPEELTRFYTDLFGWKFTKAPLPGVDYWLCETGRDGPGIDGAIAQRQNSQQPWMNYVDVANVETSLAAAAKLGAKIAMPRTAVPGVGAIATIIDPEGNICG